MRLYLCFWLAGIYTYNAAIQQQPDPKVPPAMTRPPHLCLSIMGSDKEVAPSFRRLRSLSGMAYRCVHAESRGPSLQHAIDGPPRVITAACCAVRPLSGDGRLRLGYDKSNGNGVAQQKSVGSR